MRQLLFAIPLAALAFAGLTPDPKVIGLAGSQPEFTQSFGAYVDNRVTAARIAQGRKLAERWKPALDRIEASTGVDRYTILAIWAMESKLSRPFKVRLSTGTPSTGSVVIDATMPGRCAAPPAPAMITFRPRAAAPRA